MNNIEELGLKDNPFRMTPNLGNVPVWAGFHQLKKTIEKRITFSLKLSSSSLILNWGAYGSGKTHAATYFTHESILGDMSKNMSLPSPFALKITLPKGKNPVKDFFNTIIDYLDIEKIRSLFQQELPEEQAKSDFDNYITATAPNTFINAILRNIFISDKLSNEDMKSFLYKSVSNSILRDKFSGLGILRNLETDDDYIQIIAGIFSCLTYKRKVFSTVIIWVDEFESIATLSHANIAKTNHLIRELLDNAPNHLLIFLNFTFSAIANIEDLGLYLDPSVMSRIKDRINLQAPNKEAIEEYIKELLDSARGEGEELTNLFAPFTREAIDFIVKELQGGSLRNYNEALSMLIELALMTEKEKIGIDLIEDYKSELLWK